MKKIYILTEEKLEKMIDEKVQAHEKQLNLNLQKKYMEKEINLANLQSQINPHFLYNALEGIRGQAIVDNVPVIEKISQALANYFRYNISSKSDIVTLKEELNNVENYLSIQQFRFNNRFEVEMCYETEDADVLETLMPKLTLQPILENAISHGLEKAKKQARIEVRIVKTKKHVTITISDNGKGISESGLKAMNDRIKNYNIMSSPEGKHNGIAMPNIDRRIKLMYGDDYGLHISSVLGIGTDVEVYLPFCDNYEQVK